MKSQNELTKAQQVIALENQLAELKERLIGLAPTDRNTEFISLIINMNQSLINIISK